MDIAAISERVAEHHVAFLRTPLSPLPPRKRRSFPDVLKEAQKAAKKARRTVYVIKVGREYEIVEDSEYFSVYSNYKPEARVSPDGRIATKTARGRFKPGDVVRVQGERGKFTVVKRDLFGLYTIEDERGRRMNWYPDEMQMKMASKRGKR